MNTQRLRDAAVKIRDAALAADDEGGWYAPDDHPALLGIESPRDTAHIALWSPTVALGPAALLVAVAAAIDAGTLPPEGAVALAADRTTNAILGQGVT